MSSNNPLQALLGLTLSAVENTDNTELIFRSTCGRTFEMSHSQDCCEHVRIEDIVGDLQDLVGSPILHAEESSSNAEEASESGTWTFYKLATAKGWVDIRWLGESNGYYSERVDFFEVTK